MNRWTKLDPAQVLSFVVAAAVIYAFTSIAALQSFTDLKVGTFGDARASAYADTALKVRAGNPIVP